MISTDGFKITPVSADELPPGRPEKGGGRYAEMVRAFLESGCDVARLDLDWPEETTNGDVGNVAQNLRNSARSLDAEVVVMVRRGDIYLSRKKEAAQ